MKSRPQMGWGELNDQGDCMAEQSWQTSVTDLLGFEWINKSAEGNENLSIMIYPARLLLVSSVLSLKQRN